MHASENTSAPRNDAGGATDAHRSKSRRSWLSLLLRVVVTAIALTWTASRLSFDELARAFSRMDAYAATCAIALTYANLLVGAARWRLLLEAYGARDAPTWPWLARAYLVSLFYNTFLPANIGGDVLRAHVTRRAFPTGTGAYVVVFIERAFGLAGLLLLGAAVTMVRPLHEADALRWLGAAAAVAALGAATAPVIARRLGTLLRGSAASTPDTSRSIRARAGSLLAALPSVRKPWLLGIVLALSICTQLLVAVSGHLLINSITTGVALSTSLVLVPLALIAIYFPTIAGLGVREAAFVVLFGKVGVSAADATAASLSLMAVQLVVALTGGLTHLVAPLRMGDDAPEAETNPSNKGTV